MFSLVFLLQQKGELYALFGQICCVVAYTFIGPAPFVPYAR